MSDDPRNAILGAIRRTLGRQTVDPAQVAREAQALVDGPARYQPKFDSQSNRARFIERATSERLTATVDEVPVLEAAPEAVRQYLLRAELPFAVSLPPMPELVGLDWGDIAVHETLDANEPVAVTLADYAIAETGSLVFTSRPESPTLYNFLPLHHIILLDAARILRYSEDYWAIVREAGNSHPRSINVITGTSGTADIEGQNIRGAHGPRFMHMVIFGQP